MGRHPRAEQSSAEMVGVHVLRVDRDRGGHVGAVPLLAHRAELLPRPAAVERAARLRAALRVAKSAQSQWTDRIAALDAAAIQADPELVQFAIAGGEKSFKYNCATCHGLGGAGQGF